MDISAVLKKLEELNSVLMMMQVSLDGLTVRVEALEARARTQVEYKNASSAILREMTKDDARRVLTGNLAESSHKEAAASLGLSYQQIYSCRFGYTFKPIHRELERGGWVNQKWARK